MESMRSNGFFGAYHTSAGFFGPRSFDRMDSSGCIGATHAGPVRRAAWPALRYMATGEKPADRLWPDPRARCSPGDGNRRLRACNTANHADFGRASELAAGVEPRAAGGVVHRVHRAESAFR